MPPHSATRGGQKNILILGAGISGLSAAWRLHRLMPNARITIWEKSSRVGGVIETVSRDGLIFEQSSDNFITTTPHGLELCRELGLADMLVQTNSEDRRTYVVCRGHLHPLPDGFMMLAPTKLWPMVTTPLLSWFGKARAGLELLLPRKKSDSDETIAAFARRRLGAEVTARIVEPLLSGIYAGDAEKISLLATLPRFRELEKKERSLILAMAKGQRAARREKRAEESGARYSLFVTLREGMAILPETIEKNLPEGMVERNRAVARIERVCAEENSVRWRATDIAGGSEMFDGVIGALPSSLSGDLFAESVPAVAHFYSTLEQTGCAIVSFAFRTEQIRRDFRGMGFVVPTHEGGSLIAGSFSSHKYPHRAPKGVTLIRLFAGGARAPQLVEMEDTALSRLVLEEIRPLLDIIGSPMTTEIARWPRGMPQYHLGHLEQLDRLNEALKNEPTLAVCGNSFTGVGLPACIESGYKAAEKLAEDLRFGGNP